MKIHRHLALLLVAAHAHAAGELPARDFAVKAGTVIRIDQPDLSPGIVIVREGRIRAVGGEDLAIPDGLPVVDASTRVLMPGFVEAHSQRGLDRSYETTADASFVRTSDALNAVSIELEDARRNGITTLLTAPDDRAFLAGRAAIIHPQGIAIDSMIVRQDAALKISLLPQPGTSRMGHLAKLREVLDGARRHVEKRARRGTPPPEDSSREALVALLADEMPALVYCPEAEDVTAAFAIASEHGFHVVPIVPPSAWRAAPLLKANGVTAILTPSMEAWERQPDGTLRHVQMARLLHDAGVPFALTTDPYDVTAQHPWYQAALAVRQGVPRAAALASITSVPARLLGFGARKGVIAEGADADFLLLSADPLAADCFVEEAYIRGARTYAREADEKLKRLLSRTSEPPLMSAEPDDDPADEVPPKEPEGRSLDEEKQGRWPLGTPR